MRYFKTLILLISLDLMSGDVFCQQSSIYQRAADLCEAAAKKYDAKGCIASAAYCRQMRDWNLCMVKALAGQPNSCGVEPLPENAPKCEESAIGGTTNSGSKQNASYQSIQAELDNAKNASMNAYEQAINSGKNQSGAMMDATLAGAQYISDPKASLIYTGIGLGISLYTHFAEKKAEKQEKEMELQHEEERKNLVIQTKAQFIKEALDINQYGFTDLISKDRYATLLLVPKSFNPDEQQIYFTMSVPVMRYSDSTYPLKPEVEKKLIESVDKSALAGMTIYTLYPIVNIDKFTDEFVKKMGSGKVIYLNATLLNFNKNPFVNSNSQNGDTDFWGNPIKKNNKTETNKSSKNDFWNN